jgi:hypothetical protein
VADATMVAAAICTMGVVIAAVAVFAPGKAYYFEL